METLLRLLLLLLGLFFGVPGQTPGAGVPPPETDTFEIATVITSVEARILESFPVQIHLQVSGYQPDGCDFPVEVRQTREGSRITVEIFRRVPIAVMCTMNIPPYEEVIPLDGGFEPGTYQIDVNGTIIEVTI